MRDGSGGARAAANVWSLCLARSPSGALCPPAAGGERGRLCGVMVVCDTVKSSISESSSLIGAFFLLLDGTGCAMGRGDTSASCGTRADFSGKSGFVTTAAGAARGEGVSEMLSTHGNGKPDRRRLLLLLLLPTSVCRECTCTPPLLDVVCSHDTKDRCQHWKGKREREKGEGMSKG